MCAVRWTAAVFVCPCHCTCACVSSGHVCITSCPDSRVLDCRPLSPHRQAFNLLLPAEAQASVGRDNVRLREYAPSCKRGGATFTGQDDVSVAALGLVPAKVLLLEARVAGQVTPESPLASSGTVAFTEKGGRDSPAPLLCGRIRV